MERNGGQDTRLFRFIVLAILILIFITVATIKIWELRIAAERVGVLHTLSNLRSALGMKLGEVVIQEGATGLVRLHHSNPMQLWNPPPSNYLGEFTTDKAPDTQGVWYFDLTQQVLIYHVHFADHFNSSNSQYPELARYQLRMNYNDSNNNQLFDASLEQISGFNLEPVDSYRWFNEPESGDKQ
jgi:hypothetical protein